MRLGIKGKSIPFNELPNSNYVFLIDVSASMNSLDKLGILKTGFKQLADELEPEDKVEIASTEELVKLIEEKRGSGIYLTVLGAGQTITALYEVVLKKTDAAVQYAKFDFRYKMPGSDISRPISINVSEMPVVFTSASESTRFAVTVAGFGLLMRESHYSGSLDMEMVREIAGSAVTFDPHGYRKEFVEMINRLR